MPYLVKKLKAIDGSSLEKLSTSVQDFAEWCEDEFQQVSRSAQRTEPVQIWNSIPPKLKRGLVVYADGTHWNPGAGEGQYFYNNAGQWVPEFTTGPPTDAASNNNAYGRRNGVWVPVVYSVKTQTFTASGTYTPSPGLLYAIMEACGGGGAGGGCANSSASTGFAGCGGNSGGYSRSIASAATIGASQTVTIGAGGTPGAVGLNPGGAGGATSIGTLCVANGGPGGPGMASSTLGLPVAPAAAGTGNIVAAPGNVGMFGFYCTAYSSGSPAYPSGAGANSPFGSGGLGVWNTGTGNTGTGYGSGGSGGSYITTVNNAAGGAGRPGIAIITEFCSQ